MNFFLTFIHDQMIKLYIYLQNLHDNNIINKIQDSRWFLFSNLTKLDTHHICSYVNNIAMETTKESGVGPALPEGASHLPGEVPIPPGPDCGMWPPLRNITLSRFIYYVKNRYNWIG